MLSSNFLCFFNRVVALYYIMCVRYRKNRISELCLVLYYTTNMQDHGVSCLAESCLSAFYYNMVHFTTLHLQVSTLHYILIYYIVVYYATFY